MKLNRISIRNITAVILAVLVAACGGGGSESNNENPNPNPNPNPNSNPGVIPTLIARSAITAPTGFEIFKASLNRTGNEVAVLFKTTNPTLPVSTIFGELYSLQIFDTTNGSWLRTMDDPGATNQLLDLYWGDDQISVLLFPGMASWNSQTGQVKQVEISTGESDCDFLSPVEAFNSSSNVLYSGQLGGVPEICAIDLSSYSATAYNLVTSASAARISGMSLSPDGSELVVSFDNDALRSDSVQVYDAQTLAPIGSALNGTLGEIIAAGDGFDLYLDGLDLTLQPTGSVIEGFDNDVTASSNGQVMALHDAGNVRFIALPGAVYIGEATQDIDANRSISADGSVAAIVIERQRLEIHTLTSQSSVSALEPPVTYSKQFAGSLEIDGVQEDVSGTCDIEVEEGLGPVHALVQATTTSGATLSVRGVGIGADSAFYTYTVGDIVYVNSWILATNFSLESPILATDGTNITGSTLLYTFSPTEFFDLETDSSDATGYSTKNLVLDAVCTP